MSICYIKQTYLCDMCGAWGIYDGAETTAIELNDLCDLCMRKTRVSYVSVVSAKLDQSVIDAVKLKSPWCKAHKPVGLFE